MISAGIFARVISGVLWGFFVTSLSVVTGTPAPLDAHSYAAIHPRLYAAILARTSGEGCGSWYTPYNRLHAAVRSSGTQQPVEQAAQAGSTPQQRQAQQQLHQEQQTPQPPQQELQDEQPKEEQQRPRGSFGSWFGRRLLQEPDSPQQQQQQHQPPARYAVFLSTESGLADRLGCSLSAFFYALLTDRVFEYVWYGNHVLWESYQSPWIDWRAPPRDVRRGATVPAPPGAGGPVLPVVTENHHWSQPGRSILDANFYINPPDPARKSWLQGLFGNGDLLSYGSGYDVVQWMSNSGLLSRGFRNPKLSERLKELGLTWERALPCLFNYLYVPSPEALALFKRGPLLDKLLDPDSLVIGIQVRIGDWVFRSPESLPAWQNPASIEHGYSHFHCAQQLTDQLVSQGLAEVGPASWLEGRTPGQRRLYWLLISDSPAFRSAAARHYQDGRLLVADVPVDHVQDFPRHGQMGLHAAAAELWLFGLAHLHVVSVNSAFGRLGAVAGGPKQLNNSGGGGNGSDEAKYRIYGVSGATRSCQLPEPDGLDYIAEWWVGLRRTS